MITNGSVKYSLPAAFAENRPGTEVILHFAVPDTAGVDYAQGMLVYVGDLAREQARRLQNGEAAPADHPAVAAEPEKATRRTRKAAEVPAADPLSQAGSAPSTAAETATASASEPSVATGPVLDAVGKPVADPLAAAGTPTASTQTSPSAAPSGPAAGTTDPLANAAGATTPVPAANGSVDGVSAGVTTLPAATELSNADLSKAIMGAMQTLSPVYGNDVAAQRVGETIRSYASEAAQIPVDKRTEFVEKLRVLA